MPCSTNGQRTATRSKGGYHPTSSTPSSLPSRRAPTTHMRGSAIKASLLRQNLGPPVRGSRCASTQNDPLQAHVQVQAQKHRRPRTSWWQTIMLSNGTQAQGQSLTLSPTPYPVLPLDICRVLQGPESKEPHVGSVYVCGTS